MLGVAAALAPLALAGCQEEETAETGHRAPHLAALTLDGDATDLSPYMGRATVVSFWLIGCLPCLTEMPTLEAVHQAEGPRGMSLVAVSVGCTPAVARQVAREAGATFPFLVDELGLSADRFDVSVYPTTLVLDGEGIIRARFVGEIERTALVSAVRPLLRHP